MRSLLARSFAKDISDRPASMDEVVFALASVAGMEDTGRTTTLFNLGASLVDKASALTRPLRDQPTADAGVLREAIDAFGGASRLAASDPVMRADALTMQGTMWLWLKETANAEVSFLAALETQKRHGRARFNLGVCLSASADKTASANDAFRLAAEIGEMRQADLSAFRAPSAESSADQATAHLRRFESEQATIHDAASGRPHSIGALCVHLTLSELKTNEYSASSAGNDNGSNNAWAGTAAQEADALLPSGVSLRCVRSRSTGGFVTAMIPEVDRGLLPFSFLLAIEKKKKELVDYPFPRLQKQSSVS